MAMDDELIEFEWFDDGFKEILNSDELGDVCEDVAKEIARKASIPSFEYERWHSNMKGGRIAARVMNADDHGLYLERKYRRLSKAVMQCAI